MSPATLAWRAALSQFVNTPDCVYSYIFIDCPPRLDVFSVNVLVAADVVLTPIVPEPLPELTLGSTAGIERHVLTTFGFPDVKPVEGILSKCEVIVCAASQEYPP